MARAPAHLGMVAQTFKSHGWTFALVALALATGCVFSHLFVAKFARPNLVRVATYGRRMPWDALLTSPNSQFGDGLADMVSEWAQSKDITQILPESQFHIREVRHADWHTWDPVREARSSLTQFDPRLFMGEKALLHELTSLSRPGAPRVPHTGQLVVALTPESDTPSVTVRLESLREAVARTYPRAPKPRVVAKACPTYDDVIKGLAGDEIDFALCSPYSAYLANEGIGGGRLRLLGQTRKTPDEGYEVVLIKSKDKYKIPDNIDDLTFTFGSRFSTSGYLVPLRMLNGLGVNLDSLRLDSTPPRNHDEVIDRVQSKSGYVAGVPSDKLDPYFDAAERDSWIGAAIGAALGLLIWLGFSRMLPWAGSPATGLRAIQPPAAGERIEAPVAGHGSDIHQPAEECIGLGRPRDASHAVLPVAPQLPAPAAIMDESTARGAPSEGRGQLPAASQSPPADRPCPERP
jgi:hypothetical protein